MDMPIIAEEITQDVLHAVARAFRVPIAALHSRSRQPYVAHARQAAMYLLRQMWPELASYPEIGKALGRDHTTVIFGVAAAEQRVQSDPVYAQRVAVALACLEPGMRYSAADEVTIRSAPQMMAITGAE